MPPIGMLSGLMGGGGGGGLPNISSPADSSAKVSASQANGPVTFGSVSVGGGAGSSSLLWIGLGVVVAGLAALFLYVRK
jgi:hypothetical protein